MVRRVLPILAATSVLVSACQDSVFVEPSAPALGGPDVAASSVQEPEAGTPISGEYVVMFTDAVTNPAAEARGLVQAFGGDLGHVYGTALRGFSARLPERAVEALSSNPRVAYVGPNRVIRLDVVQANPTWGLDRIDEASLPLDGAYGYAYDGSGVNVYIIDTGIQITHDEFGGRAQYLPNLTNGNFVSDSQTNAEDCHGHGTHVAGTAAGALYGVAKNATVWAVRVLDCSGAGTSAGLVAAVDWIAANHAAPATANMSLSSGIYTDPPIDAAVAGAVLAGVNFQAAAGNGFLGVPLDACQTSPARTPSANTIGATDVTDTEAPFSNYGTCVDLLAPGGERHIGVDRLQRRDGNDQRDFHGHAPRHRRYGPVSGCLSQRNAVGRFTGPVK